MATEVSPDSFHVRSHWEHSGQDLVCLPMSLKTCALLSLLWMKLNIKNLKEPVQTRAFPPANKLCPLLSTQWYIHIQEYSAGVHDVQGLHLPTLSERVAEGTWKRAQKGRGFGNRIQSWWRKGLACQPHRAGWVPGKSCPLLSGTTIL